MSAPIRCIALMGATATGKSALATSLAPALRGEIVSMDSRQVYRGFDIGTAKPSPADRDIVPHHLIDTLEPEESYSAGQHSSAVLRCMREIAGRGAVPFLVGGTGLYFRVLFRGLGPVHIPREAQRDIRAQLDGRTTRDLYVELNRVDPERAVALSENDRVRVTRALEIIAYTGRPASEALRLARVPDGGGVYLKLVLSMPRVSLRARIAQRTAELFAAGWVDEVRQLIARGVPPDAPAMQSLGYAEIAAALGAGHDPERCLDGVVLRTQQYAKRQETFFRSEADAVWLAAAGGEVTRRASELVSAFLAAGRDASEPQ